MAQELTLNSNEVLKEGSKGAKVQQLQQILKILNFDLGTIDGNFGNKTVVAVKQFQTAKRLEPDGVVGIGTQTALNNALNDLEKASLVLYGGVTRKVPLPGVTLIKEFEGLNLSAYPDPLTRGKPITIGWGTTRKKNGGEWKLGEKITRVEADELLMLQLENSYLPTLEKIPVWDVLNVNQQGALLSFGYNLGANFYGAKNFESMTGVLQNQQWDQIEETFVKYRNPGSSVEAGLRRRRQAEAKLFLTPILVS